MHTLHYRFEMERSDWSFQHSSSAKLFVHSFTRPSFWVGRRETTTDPKAFLRSIKATINGFPAYQKNPYFVATIVSRTPFFQNIDFINKESIKIIRVMTSCPTRLPPLEINVSIFLTVSALRGVI